MEEKNVRFALDVPIELHRKVKALCAMRGVSIRKIVIDHFEKEVATSMKIVREG